MNQSLIQQFKCKQKQESLEWRIINNSQGHLQFIKKNMILIKIQQKILTNNLK